MDALDGNAIAGDLHAAYGHDMTSASGACKDCHAISAFAELRVYVSGPGTVARCPGCEAVVVVLVRGAVHLPGYELHAL